MAAEAESKDVVPGEAKQQTNNNQEAVESEEEKKADVAGAAASPTVLQAKMTRMLGSIPWMVGETSSYSNCPSQRQRRWRVNNHLSFATSMAHRTSV